MIDLIAKRHSMMGGAEASTLLNGLVSYWKLDESSGDAIDSQGSNNGAVVGATQGVAGQVGNAYSFDGNDFIRLFNNFDQTGSDPFSMSAGFKTSTSNNIRTLFSKNKITSPYTGYQLGLNVVTDTAGDAGKIGFVCVSFEDPGFTVVRRQTVNQYNDNIWHHVVVTYDGSKLREGILIYIDGDLASVTDHDSASFTGTLSNTTDLVIGARSGSNQGFLGSEDDVKIWNRTLTGPEALEDYTNFSNGIPLL